MNDRLSLCRWVLYSTLLVLFVATTSNFGECFQGHICVTSGRPSVTATSTRTDLGELIVGSNDEERSTTISIYVHIPFCRRRCRYCDFAIVPIGTKTYIEGSVDNNNDVVIQKLIDNDTIVEKGVNGMIKDYTLSVRTEIAQECDKLLSLGKKISVCSIYFGGGTPSLAPVEMLEAILGDITDKDSPFCLTDNVEMTIEIDPGTFSMEKLIAIHKMGFNRLSLGVQSFDDIILESLGRTHRNYDIYNSLRMIKEVFGNNVNLSIDLISGLPGLSLAEWTETLQTAINLDPMPVHLSLYDLQIESGTVFGKWYGDEDDKPSTVIRSSTGNIINMERNRPSLPSPENSAFMYKYAAGYLRSKNFEHYEVSSYAFKGSSNEFKVSRNPSNRSVHNQNYWAVDGQWYAFGLGSTSYINGQLTARPRALVDYSNWVIARGAANDSVNTHETLDLDKLMDIVLKRLRTSEGLSLTWIRHQFNNEQMDNNVGELYVDAILDGAQLGIDLDLVQFDKQQQILRLSDPHGFLFSNSIISSIFVSMENVKRDGVIQ